MWSWSRVLNITFLITYLSFSNRTFLNRIFLSIEESKAAWQQQQQESKTGLSALLSGWQPWCLRPKMCFILAHVFLLHCPWRNPYNLFHHDLSIYHHIHSAVARKPVHGITIFYWNLIISCSIVNIKALIINFIAVFKHPGLVINGSKNDTPPIKTMYFAGWTDGWMVFNDKIKDFKRIMP